MTISLGAVARLFSLPVPVYLIVLHLTMLVLVVLPTNTPAPETPWRFTRRAIPLYIMVALSCVVAMGVSYESRYRFYGFEDQPIFISIVDWLVYHPGVHPNDLPMRARQIGVLNGDSRMDTDGFSYNQAAWVWASGVTAAQLIWYDLATLFIWTVPLITFALAYEISGSESAGAWSAAGLVLVGLLTLDNIVYNPTYTAFGRFNLFQVNVLRQASLTFMLPLTLLTTLSYLRTFRRRDLVITILAGLALATMHPIQITIFVLAVGATVAATWLAKPSRANLRKLLPLALVLVLMLALPFVQRLNRAGLSTVSSLVKQDTLDNPQATTTGLFLVLRDFPVLGTTYIRDPANVFYNPAITLAVILGLIAGWWWRRNLAARYLFATTLLAMILFFTPGLTELFNNFISSLGVLTTMFLIPVALIYGFTLNAILQFLSKRLRQPSETKITLYAGALNWLAAAAIILMMGALLFEPFPITASARDQLTAYNDMQALRRLTPAQEALSASLQQHLPSDDITVLVTPYDVANVVIEDLPSTLITGGRAGRNLASSGNERFFTESPPYAPWLDTADLDFLKQWGATHIITLADTTRLPQMVLQPDRFTLLDTPPGYTVFEIKSNIQPDAIDALYAQMNDLYGDIEQPRWGRDGFNLIVPGDAERWQPIADQWQHLLADDPQNDRVRLGLAFTDTLMGSDDEALPLWRTLHEHYPDEPLYADALATTLQSVDPATDTIAPLTESLSSQQPATRVLAARRLLTDTFFYRLTHEQLLQIFAVTETDSITWDRLANLGRADDLRKRVALIMGVGEWAKAREWLETMLNAERSPDDLVAAAGVSLAMGDVDGALALLQPATDSGQIAANIHLHPDRWENNTAAHMYYLLKSEIASREGRTADAQDAMQQAEHFGAGVNQADWRAKYGDIPLPALVSPLTIADTGSIYVSQPQVTRTDEHTITISATFGDIRPNKVYPMQTWRIQIISPDSTIKYAEQDVPAYFVDGWLVRPSIDVALPPDIPELTPALLYIQPRYDNTVTTTPVILPVVLNRPDSAAIPSDATGVNVHFSNDTAAQIVLEAYHIENKDGVLNLTLYWQTDTLLGEDYQVFVHVLDADGNQVGGQDSAPVDNRYPTSQWRTGVTIADLHAIPFDQPLSPGEYTIQIGLYRLSDGARLTITPSGGSVQDNSLTLGTFEVN